jgi:hypothetical protein
MMLMCVTYLPFPISFPSHLAQVASSVAVSLQSFPIAPCAQWNCGPAPQVFGCYAEEAALPPAFEVSSR